MPPQVSISLKQECKKHPGGAFSGASGSPNHLGVHSLPTPSSSPPPNLPMAPITPILTKSAPWPHNLLETNVYHLCHCFYLHKKYHLYFSSWGFANMQLCPRVCVRSTLTKNHQKNTEKQQNNLLPWCFCYREWWGTLFYLTITYCIPLLQASARITFNVVFQIYC